MIKAAVCNYWGTQSWGFFCRKNEYVWSQSTAAQELCFKVFTSINAVCFYFNNKNIYYIYIIYTHTHTAALNKVNYSNIQ